MTLELGIAVIFPSTMQNRTLHRSVTDKIENFLNPCVPTGIDGEFKFDFADSGTIMASALGGGVMPECVVQMKFDVPLNRDTIKDTSLTSLLNAFKTKCDNLPNFLK